MPYGRFTYTVERLQIVRSDGPLGDQSRELRSPRALRLPSALQRREAHHRLRPADRRRSPAARRSRERPGERRGAPRRVSATRRCGCWTRRSCSTSRADGGPPSIDERPRGLRRRPRAGRGLRRSHHRPLRARHRPPVHAPVRGALRSGDRGPRRRRRQTASSSTTRAPRCGRRACGGSCATSASTTSSSSTAGCRPGRPSGGAVEAGSERRRPRRVVHGARPPGARRDGRRRPRGERRTASRASSTRCEPGLHAAGRIPGTVNLAVEHAARPRDGPRAPGRGAARDDRAVVPDDGPPPIAYCGGGISATLDVFALALAGARTPGCTTTRSSAGRPIRRARSRPADTCGCSADTSAIGPGPQASKPARPADALRRMRLHELKGALARDDYVVDPQAVAEAMLRRGRGSIATGPARRPTSAMDVAPRGAAPPSDPAAGPDRSPALTAPTHAMPGTAASAAARSRSRATQAQSS